MALHKMEDTMGNLRHAIEAAERRARIKALGEAKKHLIDSIEPKQRAAKVILDGLNEALAVAKCETEPFAEHKRPRGRPKKDGALEQITLRLDPRVLAHYRATGEGWQARINEALKKSIGL